MCSKCVLESKCILSIKCLAYILVLSCSIQLTFSQKITAFRADKKWGYKEGETIIIPPSYDTAFAFDKSNRLALVANKNAFNTSVNPLTGEELPVYDYSFINKKNEKLKLLPNQFPDSLSEFPFQEELQFNYLDTGMVFKVLFQNKIYLFNKKGKQLSTGFDNIYSSNLQSYFFTEEYLKVDTQMVRIKGLIRDNGEIIIKNSYERIIINPEDSAVYCCSSGYMNRVNDDVYDLTGKIIYSSIDHINYSSKTIHVTKSYKNIEQIFVENDVTKQMFSMPAEDFYYLKNNKGLIVSKNTWYFMDLLTGKKQKVNKDDYYHILNSLPTP